MAVSLSAIDLKVTCKKRSPQAAMKFFDPAIFQKCWWGQGAKSLVAAAAAKHPGAYFCAAERVVRKSDSFFEAGRTRPLRLVNPFQQTKPCKRPGGTFTTG